MSQSLLAFPNAKSRVLLHVIAVGVIMVSGTIVLSVLVVVWTRCFRGGSLAGNGRIRMTNQIFLILS
jgi:hypothetical protein